MQTGRWRRRLRRFTYVLLFLLAFWTVAVQYGCLAMRTPDAEWSAKLREKSQALAPVFHDVPSPTGRTVHAVSISASDTLPLVAFVHGSPGSADAFSAYLADTMLSRSTRMVSIDRPGFGYTDFGKPEVSLARQAEDMEAVLSLISPDKKVILVGHSMGGPVIARTAIDHPERVAGLIFVAGSIDPAQEEHPWWQTAVDNPPLCWLTPLSLWTSNREIRYLEAELAQMLPEWEKIRCPVTIIHAYNDRLVPYANVDFAKRMLVNSPRLNVIALQEGDHFILWTRQDLVGQAILDMLQH